MAKFQQIWSHWLIIAITKLFSVGPIIVAAFKLSNFSYDTFPISRCQTNPEGFSSWDIVATKIEPWSVVMGDDLCLIGCGFESRCRILDGHFFTLICCKNCIVSLKRPKINEKRPGLAHLQNTNIE